MSDTKKLEEKSGKSEDENNIRDNIRDFLKDYKVKIFLGVYGTVCLILLLGILSQIINLPLLSTEFTDLFKNSFVEACATLLLAIAVGLRAYYTKKFGSTLS